MKNPEAAEFPEFVADEPEVSAEGERTTVDLRMLGARIREFRVSRNMKQSDVAANTGLSVSMVSAVERGATNCSIGTLIAVADALGVTLAELVGLAQVSDQHPVIRLEDQLPLVTSTQEYRRRLILRDPVRGIEMAENEYAPGHRAKEQPSRHGGIEFGLVLQGALKVELGDQIHDLREGDAIVYRSTIPHRLVNSSDGRTRTIWVNLYREQ